MPPKKAKSPKKSTTRTEDRHRSGFMVRIPEAYKAGLQEIKAKTGCPFSEAVRRALDAYLKANGIQPPASST